MTKNVNSESSYKRMNKAQLTEKMRALQNSSPEGTDLQQLLHDLEVYQIELEMQNRELIEAKKSEENVLERYVSLYDFAPSGYVTLDHSGNIKEINLTLTKLLGVDRKVLLDRSLSAWIFPADVPLFRTHLRRCRAEVALVTTEMRLLKRDKTVLFVELISDRCTDPSLFDHQFRTVVTDISSRKKAEQERDRFFDLSTDLLSLAGADGYFKRVNPAWESVVGYTCNELLAYPFLNFIHPDDREMLIAYLPKMQQMENLKPLEARFIKKDRSVILLSWKSVLVDDIYYSVTRDITVEHKIKIEIENDQNWLREMIEVLPSAMVLIESGSGKIITASSGIYKMAGVAQATREVRGAQAAFVTEDAEGNILSEDMSPRMRAARGEEIAGEHFMWRTPGGNKYLQVYSRNIVAKYGRPAMALIVSQDVSDLKTTEQSLQDAVNHLEQERGVRERFVSTLTHDLRTPLSAVKMGSQLVLKSRDKADIVKIVAEQVLESVERLDYMITDLLDANRISAGEKLPIKLKNCNLVALAKKALGVLTEIHGDRFKLTGLTECPALLDSKLIHRVIENLCNNAIKYGDPLKTVTVNIANDGKHILLSVHNHGPAIPLRDQETLFTAFQRTLSAQASGKRGWGIGLTLIRGITESHGGRAYLVSNETSGTTFYIELPRPPAGT